MQIDQTALKRLKSNRHQLTAQEYRTLKGQILAGDADAAMQGLTRLLTKAVAGDKPQKLRVNYIDPIDALWGLKAIPDGTVDLILTDPPYGIDYQGKIRMRSQRFKKILNDKTPFIWWVYDAVRVLKPGGCLLCFSRWDVQQAFMDAIQIAGLKVKSVVVWDKGGYGMGDTKASFSPAHETIIFAVKPGYQFPGRRPKDVIFEAKVASGKLVHPNEKPTKLLETLLEATTIPGALVLDPFMGSGSTAVACINSGRDYIGFELDEEHHATAQKRVAEAIKQREEGPPDDPTI